MVEVIISCVVVSTLVATLNEPDSATEAFCVVLPRSVEETGVVFVGMLSTVVVTAILNMLSKFTELRVVLGFLVMSSTM